MNGIFWIVLGGMTGWLTGTLMGKEGYGKRLLGGYTRSLDIFFGVVGASIGGFFSFLALHGGGRSFSGYAAAALGSIALVGFVRQISAGYSPFRGGKRFISFFMSADLLYRRFFGTHKGERSEYFLVLCDSIDAGHRRDDIE